MKYKGQTVKNDNVRHVTIPRPSGDITFIAKPVVSFDEFDTLCPEPKPMYITIASTQQKMPDLDDVNYKLNVVKHQALRTHWLFLTSLRESPDITWEKVDYNNPDTWLEFATEMEEAGFTPAEVNRITNAVLDVNSLNDAQLDEARKRFLALNTAQPNQ